MEIKIIQDSLLEKLAEDVHIAWQEEKHKQGIFNHPDDIPYSELKENIKEYDRVTVRTILKSLSNIFNLKQ